MINIIDYNETLSILKKEKTNEEMKEDRNYMAALLEFFDIEY